MNGEVPWCLICSIQKGSLGAAVPLATGAEHDVPRPETRAVSPRIVAETRWGSMLRRILRKRLAGACREVALRGLGLAVLLGSVVLEPHPRFYRPCPPSRKGHVNGSGGSWCRR